MKLPSLLLFLFIDSLVGQDCPSPPLPLGTTFTPLAVDGKGKMASVEYSCRGELRGMGSSKNMCKEGIWEKPDLICATNTALNKPTIEIRQGRGSKLAVDGKYLPSKPNYFCDHIDSDKTIWGVDLLESVKVTAINISTHVDGEDAKAIEIRVGDNEDFSENQICWFILKLSAGQSSVFKCSEILEGRYVSISAPGISSPLYLCEVDVLSPVTDHLDLAQCGDEAGQLEDVTVYSNTCMVLQAKQKLNFSQGLEFCQKKGMALLHNKTVEGALAYEFVKNHFLTLSKESKQRLLVWIGLQRSASKSWHWLVEEEHFIPSSNANNNSERFPRASNLATVNANHLKKSYLGPKVSSGAWAASEPGEVGDCAVMDSSLRWSWNAIGCQISAHVSCQAMPRLCPSPPIPAGAMLASHAEDRAWWEEGGVLQLQCDAGYRPSTSLPIQCLAGRWSDHGLSCSYHTCGELAGAGGENITYLTERLDWGAEAVITCREGWSGEQVRVRCLEEGWVGSRPGCVQNCRDPPQVSNAKLTLSSSLTSMIASYTCPDGEVRTVTCLNGTWDSSVPDCGNIISQPADTTQEREESKRQKQENEKAQMQLKTVIPPRKRIENENLSETSIEESFNNKEKPVDSSAPGGSLNAAENYVSLFVSSLVIIVRIQ